LPGSPRHHRLRLFSRGVQSVSAPAAVVGYAAFPVVGMVGGREPR